MTGAIGCLLSAALVALFLLDPKTARFHLPVIGLGFLALSLLVSEPIENLVTRWVVLGVSMGLWLTTFRQSISKRNDIMQNNTELYESAFLIDGDSVDEMKRNTTYELDYEQPLRKKKRRVPLSVRLNDVRAFPTEDVELILATIQRNESEKEGLEDCVKQGLLSPFQADLVLQNQERQLRVGPYTLHDLIGQGGMGNVYRAIDRRRGGYVALKLFKDPSSNLGLIRREMVAIKQLAHPCVVTAYDVGDCDGQHYIAMELIEGNTLDHIVNQEGPLEEVDALQHVAQIAEALSQAHQRGIAHRDVKPSNVMVTDSGACKLMDLGLSRPAAEFLEYDSMEVSLKRTFGTIEFAAPEQVDSEGHGEELADVYGLGSTLFFLLTGECYVVGRNQSERLKNLISHKKFQSLDDFGLSSSVKDLLTGLLAYEPQDRIASMQDVLVQVHDLIRDAGHDFVEPIVRVFHVRHPCQQSLVQKCFQQQYNRTLKIHTVDSVERVDEQLVGPTQEPIVLVIDLSHPDSLSEWCDKSCSLVSQFARVILVDDDLAGTHDLMGSATGAEFLSLANLSCHNLEQAVFKAAARAGDSACNQL